MSWENESLSMFIWRIQHRILLWIYFAVFHTRTCISPVCFWLKASQEARHYRIFWLANSVSHAKASWLALFTSSARLCHCYSLSGLIWIILWQSTTHYCTIEEIILNSTWIVSSHKSTLVLNAWLITEARISTSMLIFWSWIVWSRNYLWGQICLCAQCE